MTQILKGEIHNVNLKCYPKMPETQRNRDIASNPLDVYLELGFSFHIQILCDVRVFAF